MNTKNEQKSLYIPTEIIQEIERIAREEKRSFNFIAVRIFRENLFPENKLPKNEQQA